MRITTAFLTAVFIGALILAGGCTTIAELPHTQREEVQDPEMKLARELLYALLKNDGRTFCSLLPEELRKKFPREEFSATRKAVVESLGEPVSFCYVTTLELPPFTPQIWKIRFRRTSKIGEEFHSEVLFRIITAKLDGKPVITAFQFL